MQIKKLQSKHLINQMKIMINNWSFKKFVISFLDKPKLDHSQEHNLSNQYMKLSKI